MTKGTKPRGNRSYFSRRARNNTRLTNERASKRTADDDVGAE